MTAAASFRSFFVWIVVVEDVCRFVRWLVGLEASDTEFLLLLEGSGVEAFVTVAMDMKEGSTDRDCRNVNKGGNTHV